MPIYKYLDLSTGHLSEYEMEAVMANLADLPEAGPRVIPHDYGAWVNVEEPTEDSEERDAMIAGRYPSLWKCFQFARAFDCNWINFDQDAEFEEGLPTHDW